MSRGALWEAFSTYGKVIDVFISFQNRRTKNRAATFAFVRYKNEYELSKAIEFGNNRRIDGRHIKVKKASYGWNERSTKAGSQESVSKVSESQKSSKNLDACRDDRSYKDALVGTNPPASENRADKDASTSAEAMPVVEKVVNNVCLKEVNYDLEIPKSDMDWLQRSAVGRLAGNFHYKVVQKALTSGGINCCLSPMGGISVLLTFNGREEMVDNLNNSKGFFDEWFDVISP